MLFDTIGATVRASSRRYSAGTIVTKLVSELGGRREATVVGRGFETLTVNAALANGTMGYYALDGAEDTIAIVQRLISRGKGEKGKPSSQIPTCRELWMLARRISAVL